MVKGKSENEKPLTMTERMIYDQALESLRGEIRILKSKYKIAIRSRETQRLILEANAESIASLPKVKAPGPIILNPKDRKTTESAVLVGSCWHIGETINKEEMGGLNEYNFDIFVRRLQFLVGKAIKFTRQNMAMYNFEELHVLLTGDMVSGIIHEELAETNDLTIVEQATLGAFVTAQAILELAQAFPKVKVTCVVGNHGRIGPKKYFKHKQSVSWDYVFYTNLALLLKKQPNVSFNIPKSFWALVNIQGWNFLVMHGDLIKSWGSIPFYGINREVAKWVKIKASQDTFFNYTVMSHFHTFAMLQSPTGEDILNGSLKGGDEYAAGLGLFNDPVQILFGVHPRYGKTWQLPINTKHAEDTPRASRYKYDKTRSIANQ